MASAVHRLDLTMIMIMIVIPVFFFGLAGAKKGGSPTRILVDTDVDTDDFFAILYLLKQDRSQIDLKAVTISANSWSDAGHAVNHLYDILYMMGRDDIKVGVGGEGGIYPNGTISPDVGGYLPIIDQKTTTVGNCRYRQAIPLGQGGHLDIDTNYGIRRALLPQGARRYTPLLQPTAQQVMEDTISAGPTTIFLIGSHTNLALLLMANPQLKVNIEHIFVMGGGINSNNPKRCCPKSAKSPCNPQCGILGNLFTTFNTNPIAEFNFFSDPFAAYMVVHSGIPITLVPLDATNTIPITKEFYAAFASRQQTHEARYCFQSLKMIHDTQTDDTFYAFVYLWDSFMAGVAVSIIKNGYQGNGKNDFGVMRDMSITVVTSDPPYGVRDGSNPFFDGLTTPMFNLAKNGVHSGHVQTGLDDRFCFVNNGASLGKCQDGYTREVVGSEGVRMLVAQSAKGNTNTSSTLNRQFFVSFLDVINQPQQSGRFNLSTQFPFYREVLYKPNQAGRTPGKPVIFDMDMSPGDLLSLVFLLKVPLEQIDLKGVLVNGNGWAHAASIDIVYDILHMMGRDDIPVGLGSFVPTGAPAYSCKYSRYIPHGAGGFIDSDTLYGLARDLPRSPRRYSADNSVAFRAPRNTGHPELRQPLAMEVWNSITKAVTAKPGQNLTVLTNGPLTNLANILLSNQNAKNAIQEVFIVGGNVPAGGNVMQTGNVFSLPSNKFSEFNFFLDPPAAATVVKSGIPITLIPLATQRSVSSFPLMSKNLKLSSSATTPELTFAKNVVSTLYNLKMKHPSYNHMDMFLGEMLGAVVLAGNPSLHATTKVMQLDVLMGDATKDGQVVVSNGGKFVKVLDSFNSGAYYSVFANTLSNKSQSAVIGSFADQVRQWNTPGN